MSGFSIYDIWSNHPDYLHSQENQVVSERQDDLSEILLPAFVATFIGATITNVFAALTTTSTPAPTTTSGCRCGLEQGTRIVGGAQITPVNSFYFL